MCSVAVPFDKLVCLLDGDAGRAVHVVTARQNAHLAISVQEERKAVPAENGRATSRRDPNLSLAECLTMSIIIMTASDSNE